MQNQDAKVMDELLANVLTDTYYDKLQKKKDMKFGTINGNDQSSLLSNNKVQNLDHKLTSDEIRKLLDQVAMP